MICQKNININNEVRLCISPPPLLLRECIHHNRLHFTDLNTHFPYSSIDKQIDFAPFSHHYTSGKKDSKHADNIEIHSHIFTPHTLNLIKINDSKCVTYKANWLIRNEIFLKKSC